MDAVREKDFDEEGYLSYVTEGGPAVLADINAAVAAKLPRGTSVADARAYVRSALERAAAAAPELRFDFAVTDPDSEEE